MQLVKLQRLHADLANEALIWQGLCVNRVVQGHVYGDLVPIELQMCCPKLTKFSRWGWLWHGPRPACGVHTQCPQLQHLTILWDPQHQHEVLTEQVNQQLRRLPNLQTLSCLRASTHSPYKGVGLPLWLLEAIQPLHTSLKSLVMPVGLYSTVAFCNNPWSQLYRLYMDYEAVTDEHLSLLLEKTPQVQELLVHKFQLAHSFAHKKCKWRQLTVDWFNCTSFMRLPLAELNTLHFYRLQLHHADIPHMQAAAGILSSIPHVKCMRLPNEVEVPKNFPLTEDRVPSLVMLLQEVLQDHIHLLSRFWLPCTWLQALKQLQCRVLRLDYRALSKDDWRTVLHQVPQLQVIEMYL